MAQSRKRLQVDPLLSNRIQARETLKPAASPNPSYVPANIPKPVIDEFINFAPLSDTVTKILGNVRDAQRKEQREILLGAAADPENLEALNTGKEIAKAVNKDGLPINLSPYHFPEGKRVAGLWLATQYRQEMLRREKEYTEIVQEDGTPVGGAAPARTYQDVANEVRAQLAAESNIYKDPLSRAAFNEQMMAYDADLQVQAIQKQENNRVEFVQNGLRQDIGNTLEKVAETGWDPEARQFVQDWDKLHTEIRPSVTRKQSLDTIMQAAFATANRLASENRYDEAALFLDEFGKVQIGNLSIEENKAAFGGSTYQTELENQITLLENRAEAYEERQLRDAQKVKQDAFEQERANWMGLVNQGLEENPGGDPWLGLQYNGVLEGIRQRHDPAVAEFVIDEIRKQLSQGYNRPENKEAGRDLMAAYARGDWEGMNTILSATDMPTAQQMYWAEKADKARSQALSLQNVPEFEETLQSLQEHYRTAGLDQLPPTVQQDIAKDFTLAQQELRQRVMKMAGGTGTEEGIAAVREALQEGSKEIVANLRTKAQEALNVQTEARSAISDAMSVNGNLTDVYNQYAEVLPLETREQLRIDKDKQQAKIRETLTSGAAQGPLEEILQGKITAEMQTLGVPEDLAQMLFDKQLFREQYQRVLSETYRSKIYGTPVGDEDVVLLEAQREALSAALKGVPGLDVGAAERAAEGLTTPQETISAAKLENESKLAGDTLFESIENHTYNAVALVQAFPALSNMTPDEYKLVSYYFSSSRKDGGKGRAERALSLKIADTLKEAQGVPEEQREQMLAKVQALHGLVYGFDPEDALRGSFTFRETLPKVNYDPNAFFTGELSYQRGAGLSSGQTRAEVDEILARAQLQLDAYRMEDSVGGLNPWARRRMLSLETRIGEIQDILEGTRVPIDAETLKPHAQLLFAPGQREEWEADGRWEQLLSFFDIQDEEAFVNAMFYSQYQRRLR